MSESQVRLIIGIGRAIAFIMGAVFSLMVGQLGMRMAVQANVRHAAGQLTARSALLSRAVDRGQLRILSAYFDLGSGQVSLL